MLKMLKIYAKRMAWAGMVAAVVLAGMPVSDAQAHSLFIQAGRYHVTKGKISVFFFAYGHHLPVDDAVRRKKLKYVHVHAPDGNVREVELRDEKCLHSYLVDYDMPGTWALSAATTPGHFTTWMDRKGRERHSIKPMSAVADKAESIVMSLRGSQWTKTYVTCDEPSELFPAVLGQGLELVPSVDPATLKQGDVLDLQVYVDGKPYEGSGFWDATYMGFSTQAEDMYVQRMPVEAGRFSLPVDVTGRWFVRFFVKTDAPEADKSEYLQQKRTATLVFEVPNERKRPKSNGH